MTRCARCGIDADTHDMQQQGDETVCWECYEVELARRRQTAEEAR